MKKLFLLLLIPLIITLTGCSREEKKHPFIVFHSSPVTKDNVFEVESGFKKGTRIHYLIYAPEGFTDENVRVQIASKNEKYSHWGLERYQANDKIVEPNSKFFRDYFVINKKGYYIVSVFEPDSDTKPLVRGRLRVYE